MGIAESRRSINEFRIRFGEASKEYPRNAVAPPEADGICSTDGS
jgi:hypothetical protein